MSIIWLKEYEFKKGHGFIKGNKGTLGKHWKIKDTSKYKGNTNGFQKGFIPWNYARIKKTCLHCKKEFSIKPSHSLQKYCSKKCFWEAILPTRKIWNKNLTIKDKKVKEWHNKGTETRKKLYSEGKLMVWNKDKKGCFSDKTTKQMSESQFLQWKTHKITKKERDNRINARLNKKHSSQTIEKMKKKRNEYWDRIGRKDWKNIRVPTIKDEQWRKDNFERDNYICQKCKEIGKRLRAHHIYNWNKYPELRYDLLNGITFCEKCHKLFHHIYGVKNNNQEQINEFLL